MYVLEQKSENNVYPCKHHYKVGVSGVFIIYACYPDDFYIFQVLCNALWCITNHQMTIDETALRQKDVNSIPAPFNKYTGYNDFKRKKTKCNPLSRKDLDFHSDALFSLLTKPYMNSSESWCTAANNIKELAVCLSLYSKYLERQAKNSDKNKKLDHPVRTVDEHATIEHRTQTLFVKDKYKLLDNAVKSLENYDPITFNEDVHIEEPFQNNVARYRFFSELQLSVPVDIISFCPGGSVVTTFCLVHVPENRSEAELLTQGARMVQKIKPQLKEYHTRAQRNLFKSKLSNIANIQPALVDFIYSELSLDASTMNHPDMQHRLRLISLGEEGLIADLRHLNTGRPNDRYDVFFEKLIELVADKTAADDRRHGTGVAHLSEWISLQDMIEQAAKKCPDGTPIPSKSLVRLQFAPNNPYTSRAQNFSARVPVQYKIQRRQLRAQHPDNHYCAALFKYLKFKAIELKDHAVLYCCDDKAKLPVGEPDKPVSTGVKGRLSIAQTTTELTALDHDMCMSSLTPSVVLQSQIPESVEQSFVRGKVTTVINDSVFQASSPFRHAVILQKVTESLEKQPSILLKYTDGGTDQRNTLQSVQCASICLFKEFNLDMLIAVRCAPGQSYINPAERIMSVLNYGLQNCATERARLDEESEKILKRCNSMAELRTAAVKQPQLVEKWKESVEPVQALVQNRFLRLKLKEEPITVTDPATSEEIDVLKRHLRELFPDLDLLKLQKVHTNKSQSYISWKANHCLETQYTFQIRKCSDEQCCLPPTCDKELLNWLPNPMLDETGEHYKDYDVVKNEQTSECDRPSSKLSKPPRTSKATAGTVSSDQTNQDNSRTEAVQEQGLNAAINPQHEDQATEQDTDAPSTPQPAQTSVTVVDETESGGSNRNESPEANHDVPMSAQTARAVAVCVECRKPRVIYSKNKLSERQKVLLAVSLSEYEYSCGSSLFAPSVTGNLKRSMCLRPNLQCILPVEIPYYGSDLGRKDLCGYCGIEETATDTGLKEQYQTVLPLCAECRANGKTPIVKRPFGKKRTQHTMAGNYKL